MGFTTLFGGALGQPNDGLLLLDNDLVILEVNEPFLLSSDFCEGDLVGQSLLDISSASPGVEVTVSRRNLVHEACSGPGVELKLFVPGRRPVRCQMFLLPIGQAEDDPLFGTARFLCFASIQDNQGRDDRLGVAQSTLRGLMEKISDPIFVLQSHTKIILGCNRGFEILTGWSREALRGKPLEVLFESERVFHEFVTWQKRKHVNADLYLGRWRCRRRNGTLITCAIVAFDLFRIRTRTPVTLYLLFDREDQEARVSKLSRLAEEYMKLIVGLERSVLTVREGQEDDPVPTPRLTRRQREIATLVAQGLSSKEVAAELSITEATVRNHLSVLFKRFSVSSRIALANELRRYGLVP